MSSSNGYLNYILEQLSEADEISHRAMMGEYILYCREKVIGGIYDDRFLIKPTEHAKKMMPKAAYELPYKGAKEMLLVDNVDDKSFLAQLVNGVPDELPAPKKKKK